jgi:hypothetical protein
MSPETHSLSHAQGAALDAAAREQCRIWYEQHGEAPADSCAEPLRCRSFVMEHS